ncbi:FUSC family protein [Streptomyces sp. DSM 118148]|uniref:FUSC family protein n=1 Tax=Streptomyces sp. DSM 118148 TaxID=3448667 RepID=UPI00403FFBEA
MSRRTFPRPSPARARLRGRVERLPHVLSPRGALSLRRVDGALLFALRAALAMTLPVLPLVLSGRPALAVFPMLGAFTTTFGRNLPYPRRARVLAVVALAMTACVGGGSALAALTDAQTSTAGAMTVIVAMAVVAGLAKFACDATGLGGLGAVLLLLSFAVAANGSDVDLGDVLPHTALAATGAVVAWALALAGWPVHPDRPQRLAVAGALRDLAGLLETGGGADGAGPARHRATAGILRAYRSLGLAPSTPARRDAGTPGIEVRLTDWAWTLLITSVHRRSPDAATARQLRRLARALTARGRRPPLPLPVAFPSCPEAAATAAPPGGAQGAARTFERAAAAPDSGRSPAETDATTCRAAELAVGTPSAGRHRLAVHVVPALRMTLGTGVAGAAAVFLSFGHGYWAAVSAAAVLHSVNIRTSVQRAVQRTLGTVTGLLVSAAILATHPVPSAAVFLIVLLEFLLEYVVARNYGLGVVFITPLALLLSNLTSPTSTGTLVYDRMLGGAVGIAIALACALLVVHSRATERVRRALAACTQASEHAERALAGPTEPHPEVQARLAAAVVELRAADDAAAGELRSVGIDPAELAEAEQRAYGLLHRLLRRHPL